MSMHINISINNICNLNCTYCDRQGYVNRANEDEVSLADFKRLIRCLKEAGFQQCRIFGGEPTLHPRFSDLIKYAVKQGMSVLLFTNGLFDEKTRYFLFECGRQITYIWNINNPNEYSPRLKKLLFSNVSLLSRFGTSLLGTNIYAPRQDLKYLGPLLKKKYFVQVRVALVHPAPLSRHIPIRPELQWKFIPILTEAMKTSKKYQQSPVLIECTLVPCLLRNDSFRKTIDQYKPIIGRCDGGFAIHPDLHYSSCNGLVSKERITSRKALSHAENNLKRRFLKHRKEFEKYVQSYCLECNYNKEECYQSFCKTIVDSDLKVGG
jgi:hypothetical protein